MKIKSIKQVKKEHPGYSRLISAVINRIGKESVLDVVNHGADAGFSGFTYYYETHKFAMTYRKAIIELLKESAEMLGENVLEMVSNFGVFRGSKMDQEDETDLFKFLGGGRTSQGTITNVMAWFALEEVCRWFED